MEEDDIDFDRLMSQRARPSRQRQRGRVPALRLHTREEDVVQDNPPAREEIGSMDYPSMCGQQRSGRLDLSESDERDYIEGGLRREADVDARSPQSVALPTATTQSDPPPSTREQV